MSHHVVIRLPDGRDAVADYRQPITHVMHRIHNATLDGREHDPADYALIGEWLDLCPEQACTMESIRSDTCAHPPAEAEHYRPPKYQRPGRRT